MPDPAHRPDVDEAALHWWTAVQQAPLDAQLQARLQAWLEADPAHRAAYAELGQVWLLTGLLPPAPQPVTDDPAEPAVTRH